MTPQSFPLSDVDSLRHGDLVARLSDVIVDDPNVTTSENQISLYQLIGLDSGFNGTSELAFKNFHLEKVRSTWHVVVLCIAYLGIFFASLSGNSLVCLVIYRTRRLHTVTNVFIANLAVSDLFITVINVPFNVARHLTSDWTFGHFTCGLVNFALTVFVYVSTFTMTAIAVDRYIVILHPLRPRMSVGIGLTVVAITWFVGSLLSLPFAIFAQVLDVELFLYTSARCSVVYPAPSDVIERYVTVTTFVTQFAIPVVVTSVAYSCIAVRLCGRTRGSGTDLDDGGQLVAVSGLLPTRRQRLCHDRVRRRSIALLAAVVFAFTVSWLPLNLYHIITDFHPDSSRFRYNSTTYLATHWIAVSSVCCNPLAYCWLNASFRMSLRSACSRQRRTWIQHGLPLCRRRNSLVQGLGAPAAANATCRKPMILRREDFNRRSPGVTAVMYDRFGYRRDAGVVVRRGYQQPTTSPDPPAPSPASVTSRSPQPIARTVAALQSASDRQLRCGDTGRYRSVVRNECKALGDGTNVERYKDVIKSSNSDSRSSNQHNDHGKVSWRADMRRRSSPGSMDVVATATIECITPTSAFHPA